MDSLEFKQSVRTEIMAPALEALDRARNEALNAELRRRYAESAGLPDQELTPMRPVHRDADSDLMLDNRERANDMRGAK